MIQGIDYYPGKRKINPKLKYWALLLIVVFIIGYWNLNDEQDFATPTSSIIVISEPQLQPITDAASISIQPTEVKQPVPEILENLDEVLQNKITQEN